MFIDPSGHWAQGDELLNDDAQAELIALTNAWYAATNQEEREEIHKRAQEIRNDPKSKKQMDPLVVIENKEAFNEALSDWKERGGSITAEEWGKAMKAINASVDVTSQQSTITQKYYTSEESSTKLDISLTTINVTTITGKADVNVEIKDARLTNNPEIFNIGVSTSIKLHYKVYSIYSADPEFNHPAMEDRTKLYEREFGKENVKAISVDSLDRFIEVWDAMAPERGESSIENVTLCFHGSPDSMAISDTGYLYNDSDNRLYYS